MNCHKVSSLISAYIDGELTGIEMLEIRRHLGDCHACTTQYESLRETKQLLARLKYATPRPDLASRICARLDVVQIPGYQRVLNSLLAYGRARVTPLAAGCAAVSVTLMLLVSTSVHGPDVVALNRSSFAVGSLGMPTVSSKPATVEDTFSHSTEAPQTFASMPVPNELGSHGVLTFAGFVEGH
jgi:anti-sigma factor RsiW